MRATQRVYRTTDGRLVPEGDPEAAFLVAGVGAEIPARFDVPDWATGEPAVPTHAVDHGDDEADDEEATKQADAPEDKAIHGPDEDKAAVTAPARSSRRAAAKKAAAKKA